MLDIPNGGIDAMERKAYADSYKFTLTPPSSDCIRGDPIPAPLSPQTAAVDEDDHWCDEWSGSDDDDDGDDAMWTDTITRRPSGADTEDKFSTNAVVTTEAVCLYFCHVCLSVKSFVVGAGARSRRKVVGLDDVIMSMHQGDHRFVCDSDIVRGTKMCQHAELVRLPLAGHMVVIAGVAYTMCCNSSCSLPMAYNPYICLMGARGPYCSHCTLVYRNQELESVDAMGLLDQFHGRPWLCCVCNTECKSPVAIYLHAGGVVTCKRHHHPHPAALVAAAVEELGLGESPAVFSDVYRDGWSSVKRQRREARRGLVLLRKRRVKQAVQQCRR
ncbi:MAG: hypothetical protein GY703_14180 [Gammaproteobacteria bacterium]|nr:hypothetical protein [Gammaproteobacteria bacterium]